MKSDLSLQDIEQYQKNGFLVIEDFLSEDELEFWRAALDEAMSKRGGNKMPDRKKVYGKGDAGIDKPLSSHIARHTFARMAIDKVNNPMITMSLLGHTSLAVHQQYLKDV
jgi:integrase